MRVTTFPTPAAKQAARRLADVFVGQGIACEVDSASDGLVVYAGTAVDARRVATQLANVVRSRDPRVRVTAPIPCGPDEAPASAWWAAVTFDWAKF